MDRETLEKANRLIYAIAEKEKELTEFVSVRSHLEHASGSVCISFYYKTHDGRGNNPEHESHYPSTDQTENIKKMYNACIEQIQEQLDSLSKEFEEL